MQNCITAARGTYSFMLMTIHRCLDYTKASQGLKLVPRLESFLLLDAMEMPMQCMQGMTQKLKLELDPLPLEVCPCVITDKQWLQENLLCLLSNAVKYSQEGTITVRTLLMSGSSIGESHTEPTSAASTFLRIEVEDMGIGMSEEAMASLFNPFKQTQRLAGGTGLGLYSLAKRLEALHGFYGVSSRRDGKQGSLFWFAVPYKADDGHWQTLLREMRFAKERYQDVNDAIAGLSMTQGRSNEDLVDKRTRFNTSREATMSNSLPLSGNPTLDDWKFSILVVDDSPLMLKMASMLLRRLGHTVQTAENGAVAVKLYEQSLSIVQVEGQPPRRVSSFDMILMDLQMPVMDGLEASRRIRSIEKEGVDCPYAASVESKPLMVIGISANSDNETISIARSAGFNMFLPKPFDLDKMRTLLQECSSSLA
jgi:CheY-like chemotaxis protein